MKFSFLHVGIGTILCVSLLSIATNASAAFTPEYYEQRRIDRLAAQQQVQADQFDRMYSGADENGIVWRTTGIDDGKGKGKGVISTPIAYVVREEVELPPLTGTGPMVNMFAILSFGLAGGYMYSKKYKAVA